MTGHSRHSRDSGFEISLGRSGTRRRMLDVLRPQGGFIPLDIDLIDVVADLDPGMIEWQSASLERRRRPAEKLPTESCLLKAPY